MLEQVVCQDSDWGSPVHQGGMGNSRCSSCFFSRKGLRIPDDTIACGMVAAPAKTGFPVALPMALRVTSETFSKPLLTLMIAAFLSTICSSLSQHCCVQSINILIKMPRTSPQPLYSIDAIMRSETK